MAKVTTIKTLITTKRCRQNFRFTMRYLTICLLCGTTFNCLVNCQIDEERQQKSLHKYQQLQYQIQQQQQLQYQQQMQQQQQYYLQQHHQEQQQQQQPISLPLTSNENGALRSPPTQMQMMKTGASLVVAADIPSENSQKEYYIAGETQPIATRRNGNVNGRKRKRRPENGVISNSNFDNDTKLYWRGHVEDDSISAAGNANSREEITNTNQKLRRRKQPTIREPLAALEKEQKLYEIRDKQRQELRTEDTITKNRDKSYRRPYSQAKKEQDSTLPSQLPTATDLKHILKNSGGLSLSEILQQKNLSLDDLLKGKQNALLALQTTAESPKQQTNLKPSRRIPPAYLGGTSTEFENNSNEKNLNEEIQGSKNKLKFPTLNRLKLFGTSSRSTAIPLPGSNVETETKRRDHISSTTTSTVRPSTTTRLPIYKKRSQQRSTLKPLLRFKVTTESTAAISVETPTSTKVNVTTHKPIDNDYETEFTEIPDEYIDSEERQHFSTTIETTTMDHVSVMTIVPTSNTKTATTTATKPSTSTTLRSTTTPISTISSSSSSNSRRNRYGTNAKQRNRTKPKEDSGEESLKSNSIESINQQSNDSKEIEDTENNSTEFDELENFFEEAARSSNERKMEEELNDTTVESITTARIDRTNNRKRYHHTLRTPITTTTTAASLEEPLPDFDGIDDRTDLLELIEDRRSGNRLFKVLQQRNMTLDQLIEHRKRGSSQLHLATVVEENARSQFFPGQKVILHDNMDIVTAFENFPHFNLLNLKSVKPDDIKTDSQGSSYFTSIIDIEPTDEIYKDVSKTADGDGSLKGPMYTQHQSLRTEKSLGFFPSWKTLALASLTSTTKGNPFFLSQQKLLLDESNSNEVKNNDTGISASSSEESIENNNNDKKFSINTIIETDDPAEAIENEVERAHDLLDLELSGHAFKRSPAATSMMKQQYKGASYLYSNMPAGIRSAIVASAAIVLTSMATFLVIFVVCRLKQRKRNKTTNYLRTYNAMKSKMPTTPALTTTSLGKLSATSTSNSRRSSLRNNLVENSITSGCNQNINGVVVSELSSSLMNIATISSNSNQRSNELLFPRHDKNSGDNTNQALFKTCTKNLLCGRRGSSLECGSRSSYTGDISNNNGGFSSITGSTSSLALSLRSAHNISSTKLNTMDPNSPEVQEYLFDTLRKSFN